MVARGKRVGRDATSVVLSTNVQADGHQYMFTHGQLERCVVWTRRCLNHLAEWLGNCILDPLLEYTDQTYFPEHT
jgi:hypothetical protein